MSKLSIAQRDAMPQKEFALPGGRYPINDPNHARAALSMAHYASPLEQEMIKRKVHEKYPTIGSK